MVVFVSMSVYFLFLNTFCSWINETGVGSIYYTVKLAKQATLKVHSGIQASAA